MKAESFMSRFSPALTSSAKKARGGLCVLMAFLACAAVAQAPPPVAAAPGLAASAPSALGGLILSPAQRRNLEVVRNTASSADGAAQVVPVDGSLAAGTGLPDTLVVSGVVVRSGNRSTVWINNQPVYGQDAVTPLRTLAGQAGVLQQGAKDMRIKARAGQVIDVPSGQTVDLLPPGAIRIIPPKVGTGSIKKE
ncbi:MAG: hypothetical protein Q8M51_14615 [Polaromonas sp.]|nr:hypothetical protein [Polaromonas sp.]